MIVAATQATADDLTRAPPKPGPPHAVKSKAVKRAQSQGSGLAGIPFSNPYGPPVSAGKSRGAEFPAAQRTAPPDPKGNLSFTAKWKASNDPVDPYWNMRSAPGSEAPGDSFMGGLKLGF
jgi:nucleoid-associated protein YgaU